jgi:hypothetical protein
MQRIDEHRERLTTLVGKQMSLQIVNQVFETSPHSELGSRLAAFFIQPERATMRAVGL